MKTPKIPTHYHDYTDHPNPAWATHVACKTCGFAVHHNMLPYAVGHGATYDGTKFPTTVQRSPAFAALDAAAVAAGPSQYKEHAYHGGPRDRGSADAWYGRPKDPHKYLHGTYNGDRIPLTDPEEIAAYHFGYDTQTGRKEY